MPVSPPCNSQIRNGIHIYCKHGVVKDERYRFSRARDYIDTAGDNLFSFMSKRVAPSYTVFYYITVNRTRDADMVPQICLYQRINMLTS